MRPIFLVYPMLAMVLLTFSVLVRLFRSRVRAVREGQLTMGFFQIWRGGTEPDYAIKPARHFVNLFEAPTLFYAACLAAMVVQTPGILIHVLAWCYVAARLVHTYIHLGSNRVGHRVRAYFVSWLVLLAMWICIAASVAMRTNS
ncbi:MAG TPA: MAPEG family protein [Steroidobacteraceae bacterium]